MHGTTKLAKFQNQVNTSKGKLLKCIAKELILVKAGKVNLIPNWERHGWALVTSEDNDLGGHLSLQKKKNNVEMTMTMH